MVDTKIYDTKGNVIKTVSSKQKTAQDAKRFRLLMKWLTSGAATLTIAGQVLSDEEILGLGAVLDDRVEIDSKAKRRQDEKNRRKKRVKD